MFYVTVAGRDRRVLESIFPKTILHFTLIWSFFGLTYTNPTAFYMQRHDTYVIRELLGS
jgi:hypothetical protein